MNLHSTELLNFITVLEFNLNKGANTMRNKMKNVMLIMVGAIICGAAILAFSQQPATAQERPPLTIDDCLKCHPKQPVTIASSGGKHSTAVTCLDCHVEHKPEGTDTIPQCSNCHEGESHFQLENCLACHSDPHQPLNLVLTGDITGPCLTCHDQQGQEFKDFPSMHAEQSCTFCHEVHGKIPDCAQCHEPHVADQVTADCLGCHQAHHPLQIVPSDETPNSACGACHDDVVELLSQTETKHGQLACAFCHQGSHPAVPTCQDCHGEPHSAAMHKQMPDCLTCHMNPHKLIK
jgi:hypothetical protein